MSSTPAERPRKEATSEGMFGHPSHLQKPPQEPSYRSGSESSVSATRRDIQCPNAGDRAASSSDLVSRAVGRKCVDDEDADSDVGDRPDRVVRHPPDSTDGNDSPGEDADPASNLGTAHDD